MLAPVGAGEREKLAAALRGAGFAHREAIAYFLSAKIGSGVVFGAAAGFFASSSALLGQHGFLVAFAALAGLVVGGVVPEYVIRALGARRVRAMSAALPDAFDLMVMGLESGLTFERSLLAVAEELAAIKPGLAAEFRQIEAELRLGANRRSVLQEFFDRTEVEGLKSLAMTLIQSERYGTSLSQSLKNNRGRRAAPARDAHRHPGGAAAGAHDPADAHVRGAGDGCSSSPGPPFSPPSRRSAPWEGDRCSVRFACNRSGAGAHAPGVSRLPGSPGGRVPPRSAPGSGWESGSVSVLPPLPSRAARARTSRSGRSPSRST